MKAKNKKTAKKPDSPQRKAAREIVDYVLDCVAHNGVIEGRRPNKKVTFRSMIFDRGTGMLIRQYTRILDNVEAFLTKREGGAGKEPPKIKGWFPVFVWRDGHGKVHYDVHGVTDDMVSNRQKRRGVAGNMSCAFMFDSDKHPEKKRAKLHWVRFEAPAPTENPPRTVPRYECADGMCPGHSLSGEQCFP